MSATNGEEPESKVDEAIKLCARHPKKVFASGVFWQLMLTVICFASGTFKLDTDKEGDVWAVHTAYATRMARALRAAKDDTDPLSEVTGKENETEEEEEDPYMDWMMFYKASDVFTPENLKAICDFELTLCKAGDCVRAASSSGRPRVGPVQIIYSSVLPCADANISDPMADEELTECPLLSASHVTCWYDWIRTSVSAQGVAFPYASMMSANLNATGINDATLSMFPVFRNKSEKVKEKVIEKLGLRPSGPFNSMWEGDDDDRHLTLGPVRVRFFCEHLFDDWDTKVNTDMSFALLACMLVWMVMWGHTQSCFLACMGMFQIFLSLPISVLFYKNIFMVDHFEFLHILILYVILGIGADDVFVLVDSWRHVSSELDIQKPGRLPQKEMEYCLVRALKRSATAVFNTSLTTTVAFLSAGISKIMPMRTMGWYAACCIIDNFLVMVFFLPSVLLIWHMHLEGKRCCCPAWTLREEAVIGTGQAGQEQTNGEAQDHAPTTMAERLIHKGYLPALKFSPGGYPVGAGVLVLASVIVAVQGCIFAAQLTPPSKPEEWMPGKHMLNGFSEFRAATFYSAPYEDFATVTYSWGIKDLDMSEFNSYHPGDYKAAVSYSSVDLTTAAAQDSLLSFCQDMVAQTCDQEGCTNSGNGELKYPSPEKVHTCFLEDFYDWLAETTNITSRVTGADFLVKLKEFRSTAENYDMVAKKRAVDVKYGSDVMKTKYKDNIGFKDGALQFFSVNMRISAQARTPYTLGVGVRDEVYAWLDKKKADLPGSMKDVVVTCSMFSRYDRGEELLSGFFSGCTIAMPVAFLVLLFATRNVVISLYSVFAVASIVVSVLGFCKSAMDWDLGTGEAIAGVIVIGYSVDYTLHLSHMYCEAGHSGLKTRAERTEFAVKNMGSTVFAGAATTFVAGAIMFACYIRFFYKMAVLISITIFYSLLFSMGFMNGLLMIAGPEGHFGDITAMFRMMRGQPPTVHPVEYDVNAKSASDGN